MLDNGFLLVPESAITKIFLQSLERIHRCADVQISDVQIDFVFSGANYKLSGRLLKFLDFLSEPEFIEFKNYQNYGRLAFSNLQITKFSNRLCLCNNLHI
jgi:hypothetical protein